MSRRLVVVTALVLVAGACGLGDKEAHADRIVAEGKRLMAQDSVLASLAVNVKVVPAEREVILQEPPRIAANQVRGIGAVMRPADDIASVAGVVLFIDDVIYERIVLKNVTVPGSEYIAPNNLNAIVGTVQGLRSLDGAPGTSTTSTTAARSLRRTTQILREWAAFDFAEIPDQDDTKHGGSFAINPVALLRLTTGVLTGSVERISARRFEANVSRDKAERNLDEDEREVLDKMFTANAVTRRVFPAQFGFGADGRLTSFEITLRQQLSSKDRADLTATFRLRGSSSTQITQPPRRGTVNVDTLGQLVTTVSGT
ncbi:MAG TPA: hypothetical protein VMZ22_06915 [Acidimicrobiales bacterium]|nr:hypothetical protein [Acidimicrobiales bacterium]